MAARPEGSIGYELRLPQWAPRVSAEGLLTNPASCSSKRYKVVPAPFPERPREQLPFLLYDVKKGVHFVERHP